MSILKHVTERPHRSHAGRRADVTSRRRSAGRLPVVAAAIVAALVMGALAVATGSAASAATETQAAAGHLPRLPG